MTSNPERQIYAVVHGTKWTVTTRKDLAIKAAKKHDYKVYSVPSSIFGSGMDLPTFMVYAKKIYPEGGQMNPNNPGREWHEDRVDITKRDYELQPNRFRLGKKYEAEHALASMNPIGDWGWCPNCNNRISLPIIRGTVICRTCGHDLKVVKAKRIRVNPGAAWHQERARDAEIELTGKLPQRTKNYLEGVRDTHLVSTTDSKKKGIPNPLVDVDKCPTCHRKRGELHKATTKVPSIKTMERWLNDGVARATDGCRVEPDGMCPHGHLSWIRRAGLI